MEEEQVNPEINQTPPPKRMSVGVALILGISGIIITAIIVGGLLANKGIDVAKEIVDDVVEEPIEVNISTSPKEISLEKIKEIIESTYSTGRVNNIILSDSEKFAYASYVIRNTPDEATPTPPLGVNKIILYDIENSSEREIWSNTISFEDPKYAGAVIAYMARGYEDKYVIMHLLPYAVGLSSTVSFPMTILNISTGEETEPAHIGIIEIDTTKGLYTYQNLEEFTESCDPDTQAIVGCGADGFWTLKKPAGEILSAPLP